MVRIRVTKEFARNIYPVIVSPNFSDDVVAMVEKWKMVTATMVEVDPEAQNLGVRASKPDWDEKAPPRDNPHPGRD